MEDHLDAARRRVDPLVATELAFHELHVTGEVGQVRAIPRGEVVEHAHVVAPLEQCAHEVGADEAAAACDENLHGRHFP